MPAGDEQERIIQDVLLSIQASIKGQKETVDQLKKINKGLGKADKSISSYTKSIKLAGKANTAFKKTLFGVGKGISHVSSILGFFTGMAAAAFKKVMDAGKSFAQLDSVIVRSRGGLDSFTSSYKAMSAEVGASVISIQDAAKALGKFGSQSMAHMAVVADTGVQSALMQLQETARRAAGPLGDELSAAMTNIPVDRLMLLPDIMKNLAPGTKEFTQAMFLMSETAGVAAQRLENLMQNADTDPVLKAWKTWQNIQDKLSATFENFSVELAQTFGDDISSGIEYLSKEILEGMLIPALKTTIGWLKDHKEPIVNTFKEVARVISIVADKVANLAGHMRNLYEWLGIGMGEDFYRAQKAMDINRKHIEKLKRDQGIGQPEKTPTTKSDTEAPLTAAQAYAKALANVKLMRSGMEGIVSQAESLNVQMKLFGIKGYGEQVGEKARQSIDEGYNQLKRAKELLTTANALPGGTIKQRAAREEKIAEAMSQQAAAAKAIESGYKNILATTGARLEQEEAMTDLHKADLDISRSLYGTPALSVTAHLNVVKALAQQKKTVEEQLKIIQEQLKVHKDNRHLQLEEIRLRTKAKRITAEQLQQVKELRDGYLDAVQAQAFGAGKFEKILITQEQNLGAAMDKNIIKRNYLLGQAGDQASKSNINAFRYSSSGIGVLEGMGGQTLSPEDLAKRAAESFKNIADPTMKAYVEEAQAVILGIHGDASKWQKESQATAQGLITGLTNLKDTIEQRGAGMGGLKGAAADVIIGGSFRRKGKVAGQITSGVRGDATSAMQKVAAILIELGNQVDLQTASGDASPGRGFVNNGGGSGN